MCLYKHRCGVTILIVINYRAAANYNGAYRALLDNFMICCQINYFFECFFSKRKMEDHGISLHFIHIPIVNRNRDYYVPNLV